MQPSIIIISIIALLTVFSSTMASVSSTSLLPSPLHSIAAAAGMTRSRPHCHTSNSSPAFISSSSSSLASSTTLSWSSLIATARGRATANNYNIKNNEQRRQKAGRHVTYYHQQGQLNMIPLSEAWDTAVNNHNNQQTSDSMERGPFSQLVKKLGCNYFDSRGALLLPSDSSSSDNDTTNKNKNDNNDNYRLYVATHPDDLPPIAQLTIDIFDTTAITLSSTSDFSAWEQAFINPAIGMYNAYASGVAYVEVLGGLRKRMRNRILLIDTVDLDVNVDIDRGDGNYDWLAPLVMPPETSTTNESTLEEIAAQSSIILALARPIPSSSTSSLSSESEEMEVVATIEVRLQPTDAKIPFSQPWLDSLERRLARFFYKEGASAEQIMSTVTTASPTAASAASATATMTTNNDVATSSSSSAHKHNNILSTSTSSTPKTPPTPLRPYLCNLCISPTLRSKGIGRALVRTVEAIAQQQWGYSHMYLHVDIENDAARILYEKEGYTDVGKRWNMFWTGGASEIGNYVKVLGEGE